MTTPTIDEQLAWMRELQCFQRRQYGTLVETGRLTRAEAARKMALIDAVIGTLEQHQANLATHLKGASDAGALKTPMALVRISCGPKFEDVAILNADMMLEDSRLRLALMAQLEGKLIGVIKAARWRQT